jgi:hypothetical protein
MRIIEIIDAHCLYRVMWHCMREITVKFSKYTSPRIYGYANLWNLRQVLECSRCQKTCPRLGLDARTMGNNNAEWRYILFLCSIYM